MKQQGAIWLGLTERALSERRYERLSDVGRMISRSAFAQLRYSTVILMGTIAGMAIMFAVPPVAVALGTGGPRVAGALAWLCMAVSFQPMLRFYRRSPLWGLAFPLIGLFYAAFTVASAVQFWRGRGGRWKGRIQAMKQT